MTLTFQSFSDSQFVFKMGPKLSQKTIVLTWQLIVCSRVMNPPRDAVLFARRVGRAPDAKLHDARPVPGPQTLFERFDIEPYSDFSAKWPNFTGLVLFCIDAKFCKKIFVGKLLTRSTRFTCFCTAQTSIFQKFFVKIFRIFWQCFAKFRYFWHKTLFFQLSTWPV